MFFRVQTWQNIQQLCIFLCWLHVLRITCPCGWLGRAVFFYFQCSVLFNSPSCLSPLLLYLPLMSFLWLQYESLYLAYLVWGLSFIYVLLSLSLPSVTSTVPACSFMMVWRKCSFIWNSRHLTLLFQKWRAERNHDNTVRRSKLWYPTVTQMVIFPKQLLLKETLK